jgi:putative ABC transport system permease protein
MFIFDIDRWVEIWVTITRNKTRSLLTGFGVFWGILMLVILLGSGNGFKNGVLKNVDGFSTNSAFFFSERTGEKVCRNTRCAFFFSLTIKIGSFF